MSLENKLERIATALEKLEARYAGLATPPSQRTTVADTLVSVTAQNSTAEIVDGPPADAKPVTKKRRGRPKGSKNKKAAITVEAVQAEDAAKVAPEPTTPVEPLPDVESGDFSRGRLTEMIGQYLKRFSKEEMDGARNRVRAVLKEAVGHSNIQKLDQIQINHCAAGIQPLLSEMMPAIGEV